MTVFDLLVIVLFFTAIGTLAAAGISAVRGRRAHAIQLLRRLAFCAVTYVTVVYAATALGKPVVLHVGDPQCDDDWCLAVANVERTPINGLVRYDVTLRIFSRARRVVQREMGAKDVYLVDARWRRYDPVHNGTAPPLNTVLQPGESVTTRRRFELPAGVRSLSLRIDRPSIVPICLVIGECEVFHKGTFVRIEQE